MRVCLAYLRAADEHSWMSLLKGLQRDCYAAVEGKLERNTKTRPLLPALEEDHATLYSHSPQSGFLCTKVSGQSAET